MGLEKLSENFQGGFDAFLPVVSESFEQIFFQPLQATVSIRPDHNIMNIIRGNDQVCCFLSFNAGPVHAHLIALPEELATRLYAMMLGEEEPATEISDEHLDGLKEAIQQLAGQLKMNFAEDAENFDISALKAVAGKAPLNMESPPPNGQGICADIACTIGEDSYTVQHYYWETEEIAESLETLEPEVPQPEVNVQSASFAEVGDSQNGHSPRNVDMLMDVKLNLTVELGRKTMLISEVLKLGKGSIVELEKSAGEPLFVLVNGRKLAEGEVVVVDDHFAIRITHLASPKERLYSLG